MKAISNLYVPYLGCSVIHTSLIKPEEFCQDQKYCSRVQKTLLRKAGVLLREAETLLREVETLLRVVGTLLREVKTLLHEAEILLHEVEILLREVEILRLPSKNLAPESRNLDMQSMDPAAQSRTLTPRNASSSSRGTLLQKRVRYRASCIEKLRTLEGHCRLVLRPASIVCLMYSAR